MKQLIVAVRDIKGNCYGPPHQVQHLGGAIRSFQDTCEGKQQNGDPTIAQHPEDFELYQLGFYDDATGEMINDKQQLAVGSNYKRL